MDSHGIPIVSLFEKDWQNKILAAGRHPTDIFSRDVYG